MKKALRLFSCICICMAAVIALSACSKQKKEFETMQDFIESETFQEEIKDQIAAYEGTGISVAVTAEDASIIYTYTYETSIQPNEELTAAFQAECEKIKSTVEATVERFKQLIDEENPTIIFRYLNKSGTELFSYEFGK